VPLADGVLAAIVVLFASGRRRRSDLLASILVPFRETLGIDLVRFAHVNRVHLTPGLLQRPSGKLLFGPARGEARVRSRHRGNAAVTRAAARDARHLRLRARSGTLASAEASLGSMTAAC
jgi:hypothetical protein